MSRLDILAVLRAPLENYPPSLNQMQILAEQGRNLVVIDVAPEDEEAHGFWSYPGVQRIRVGRQGSKHSLPRRIAETLRFSWAVRRAIRSHRPRIVIAYDPYAMMAAGLPDAFNVWHFHELVDPHAQGGLLTRRAIGVACRDAARADMVIFPDAGRADAFHRIIGKRIEAQVVFNCPRRLETPPADSLHPALADRGIKVAGPIVLFQGWIGPSRCVEAVIRSMTVWPLDASLVLIGPVKDAYRAELVALASAQGVAERVIFLGRIPYADLLGYTAGADVGLAIVSEHAENNRSWAHTAGAVNKRFEYMAVGLPQIANRGSGMKALIENTGAGILVDSEKPEEIGQAIARLLADPSAAAAMGARARQVHLDRFCYEKEFEPVLQRFDAVLQGACAQ
ncbi:glycosyltransferase [Parasphingorhabdus sp.]|uniref:glycosyltransferase n=1 Tax=Parasphingorhabdus sp. TaxID=2709688 RepID=UPI0032ED27AF